MEPFMRILTLKIVLILLLFVFMFIIAICNNRSTFCKYLIGLRLCIDMISLTLVFFWLCFHLFCKIVVNSLYEQIKNEKNSVIVDRTTTSYSSGMSSIWSHIGGNRRIEFSFDRQSQQQNTTESTYAQPMVIPTLLEGF